MKKIGSTCFLLIILFLLVSKQQVSAVEHEQEATVGFYGEYVEATDELKTTIPETPASPPAGEIILSSGENQVLPQTGEYIQLNVLYQGVGTFIVGMIIIMYINKTKLKDDKKS